MAIGWEYSLVDNSDLVEKACEEQVIKALEMVGIQAEGDVKISRGLQANCQRNIEH